MSYFANAEDITHLEAVANLVRLGVIQVNEDGSGFDSKGTVTRGEAAKCVASILRGGEEFVIDGNAPAPQPAFPDIRDHWAEPFINYCAEKGVAFAQPDGNFDPNGIISRFELLRMLEIALGHSFQAFSKWPATWGSAAHVTAYEWGLYIGLEEGTSAVGKPIPEDHPLTQDETAQFLYNALNSTPKTISASGSYEDVTRPDGTPSTLLYENFGYDSWDDVPALPAIGKGEEKKPKPARGIDPTILTDAKDIQYWPAVAALAKLGVIDGKEDGSFDPAGKVTRAEAAKLIAAIMNGGGEANAAVKAEPAFTDIQGHWAEGYIEYCADMGIVNGAGDGTFDPDGEVSVIQMYKMALTALGYDWAAYRLAGSSWAEQALECARKADGRKLTEGLANNGMDGTGADQPATREMVAQILYNALQATTIEVVPDKNASSGEVVWAYQPAARQDNGQPETLLHLRFGLDELPTVPAQPTV